MTLNIRNISSVLTAALLTAFGAQQALSAAPNQKAEPQSESKLLGILQSDAPEAEKAITCKRLAIYGTEKAVPALAPLLADPKLASWARIALEAIPGAAAGEALRAALPKVQGTLLIGVINSLGVRQDAKAVAALTEKLGDGDVEVAAAAAEALGHIGGAPAARALEQALASDQSQVRSAAAYGAVICAEQFLATGQGPAAAALCDRVRQANVPKQRALEATRGAILARQTGGIPLLLEQLRSPDAALFGIGVRTARELPGREVTQTLSTEIDRAHPDRQVPLLLALADRTDAAVMPKVLQAADSSARPLRLSAIGLLDRFGDLACVPVLLKAAAENDAELARTARSGLARMGGKEIDADLLARLRLASGKTRQVLIELAGQRRIDAAMPLVLRSIEDSDAGVRRAAVETVGLLGTERQAAELVRLLPATQNADDREDLERALTAICRRQGQQCLSHVLPLAQKGEPAVRKIGLRTLSSIGGPEALALIMAAMEDRDETIQDAAVNLLSTWPNTWPDDAGVAEPLLTLARSGKKPSHQVQGLRGYLQFIEENKTLGLDEKVGKLSDLLGIIQGPEAKRQVISVAGTLPTPKALELLLDLSENEAVAQEAYMAALNVATDRKLRDSAKDLRRKALQLVAEKSASDASRKKAAAELKKIN